MTVSDLKRTEHASILRNPLIAQIFYYASLVERWGTGTIRIARECRSQGLPDPAFETQEDRFSISFYQDPYAEDRLQEMGFNQRQIQAIAHVKQKGRITNKEYRQITGLSDEGVRRELKELIEQGLLESQGKGRSVQYVLKTSWR